MSGTSGKGPPTTVPSTPNLDIRHADIADADRRLLGDGPMSEVYRIELNRAATTVPVAVKLPDTSQTLSAEFVDRFVSGAESWERLTSSDTPAATQDDVSARAHIVDIVDWGESPVPWIAMEYMDRGSLENVLADETPSFDRGVWIGKSICRALWHAHRRGVAHHDIKPSNVLFRQANDGWAIPKVGDWDLATNVQDVEAKTGDLTVAYAAPEQLSPDEYGTPDLSTDVYQVGTLLYRLVTGQLPFRGNASEIREQKLSEAPTPPSEIADVPRAVDDVLLRALGPSKSSRYDTVAYLRDELEGLIEAYGTDQVRAGTGLDSLTGGGAPAQPGGTAARSEQSGTQHDHSTTGGSADTAADGTSGTRTGDDSADRPSSWETYREELDQRQQRFLYSVLPGPLQRLFYSGLIAEQERAEERRDEAESRFESLRQRARSQKQFVEEEVYDARLLGEEISGDAMEEIWTLEELRTDLAALEQEYSPYLRSSEQSSVTDLLRDLAEYEEYLRAKRKLTRAVEQIEPEIESTEERIDDALAETQLLDAETEQELLGELDYVSQLLRTARQTLRTEQLSDTDLESIDRLVQRERSLRAEVDEHNSGIAQARYSRLLDEAASLDETVQSQLAPARDDGDALPADADELSESIADTIDRIDEFDDTRAPEYLSPAQRERLETVRESLQSSTEFIEAKSVFDEEFGRVREAVTDARAEIESTVGPDRYLSTPEKDELCAQLATVRDRLDQFSDSVTVEALAESDRDKHTQVVETVERLEERLDSHNERVVAREMERLDEEFADIGESAVSLNRRQKLAVVRDEVHNRVIAGPGTGKTLSLACRAKYLVDRGVPPDRILGLSFNRQAASEIENRIEDLFDITEVTVSTLHSIGKGILDQSDPDHIILVGQTRRREVGRIIRSLRRSDSEFRTHYDEFEELYRDAHFENGTKRQEEYVDSIRYNPGKTLLGEEIETNVQNEQVAHRRIADTLFKRGVEYRYRQYASWADPPSGGAYTPDFTLPNDRLVVEYLPPDHVRRKKKRYDQKPSGEQLDRIHTGSDSDYDYLVIRGDEHSTETLEDVLRAKLDAAGVSTDPVPDDDEIVRRAYTRNITHREVENHFAEFVKKAKGTDFQPTALDSLDEDSDPLVYHFSHAAAILYERYNRRYETYGAFDYMDMIVEAVPRIEHGAVDSVAYDHLLVDEFQDLNQAQVEMVQAILDDNAGSHLYAVGDDWQSIYGFKGARPEYFVEFDEIFSPSETTELEINYRCPPAVVEASSALMAENQDTLSKSLEASSDSDSVPTVHYIPGTSRYQYEQNGVQRLCNLVITSIRDQGRAPEEVLVVARNEAGSPFIRSVSRELTRRDVPVNRDGGVRVTTAHSAKGTEAEHVLIANATSDRVDGFPSTDASRSLTKLVDPPGESGLAEERRIFFMALTRTKDRLDIQTRATRPSQFVGDIEEFVREEYVPVDCRKSRTDLTATAVQTRVGSDDWSVDKIGTIGLAGGYELEFVVPDRDQSDCAIEEDCQYRFEDIGIAEYDGQPQFRIDSTTTVRRV